jgi:putative transposase
MKFGFVAKHRGVWPVRWLCEALGVSRSGFHAWLARPPSARAVADESLTARVRASFVASDRTYGARRVWHDMLAEGASCGLHHVERLMQTEALRARPRRRGLPVDTGERSKAAIAANVLDRQFEASGPNQKWIADFRARQTLTARSIHNEVGLYNSIRHEIRRARC